MSRREMNPMERWRKNKRERDKKKKKLKQKKLREKDPNYGKKPDPSEKYKRMMPQTNEVPLEMQMKRDEYWKKQKDNKEKKIQKKNREKNLMEMEKEEEVLNIHPPIEDPPMEKYDDIFYECLKDKNEELYPEKEFIIHTIKKQLSLKKKKFARMVKEEEEKQRKENEQREVEMHIKMKYEEEKLRAKLLKEEKKKRENIGKEIMPGVIISTPKLTSEYIESIAPEENFMPVSLIKKKEEEEEKKILDDIRIEDIVIKKKKVDWIKDKEKEILDVPMPGIMQDEDDDDFLDSGDDSSEEEKEEVKTGGVQDELMMLEQLANKF